MYRRSSGAARRRSSCLVARKVHECGDEASAIKPSAGRSVTSMGGVRWPVRSSSTSGLNTLGTGRSSLSKKHSLLPRSVTSANINRQSCVSSAFTPQPSGPSRQMLTYTGSRTPTSLSGADSARRLSRSSSVGSRRGGDLRPLTDKEFQLNCALRVASFINTYHQMGGSSAPAGQPELFLGAGRSLTVKDLQKMTARLFDDVFSFIYRFLCPKFSMENKKREDEVTRVLTDLLYPGQLSKSHLKTIGTQSSWPQLVAMLDWLCQTVTIATTDDYLKILTTQSDSQGFASGEDGLNHCYLTFIQDAYSRWLDNEKEPDVREERLTLAAALRQLDSSYQPERLPQLQAEHEQLLQQLPPLDSYNQRLEEVVEQRCVLERDCGSLREHAATLLSANDTKLAEVAHLGQQRAALKQRVQSLRERVVQLKSRVNSQEMSTADVQRIGRQRSELLSDIERTARESSDLFSEISSTENEIVKCRNRVESLCRQLNNKMSGRQLQLPSVSPAAADLSQQLQLRLRGSPEQMTAQLKETAAVIQSVQREVRRAISALQTDLMQLEKQLQEHKSALDRDQLRHFRLESKLRRIEDQERSGRLSASDKRTQLEHQLVQVNEKIVEIQRLRQSLESQLEDNLSALAKKKVDYKSQVQQMQQKLHTRKEELGVRTMLALDYKKQLDSIMSSFADRLLQLHSQHAQLVGTRFQQLVTQAEQLLGKERTQQLLQLPAAVAAADDTVDVDLADLTLSNETLAQHG